MTWIDCVNTEAALVFHCSNPSCLTGLEKLVLRTMYFYQRQIRNAMHASSLYRHRPAYMRSIFMDLFVRSWNVQNAVIVLPNYENREYFVYAGLSGSRQLVCIYRKVILNLSLFNEFNFISDRIIMYNS